MPHGDPQEPVAEGVQEPTEVEAEPGAETEAGGAEEQSYDLEALAAELGPDVDLRDVAKTWTQYNSKSQQLAEERREVEAQKQRYAELDRYLEDPAFADHVMSFKPAGQNGELAPEPEAVDAGKLANERLDKMEMLQAIERETAQVKAEAKEKGYPTDFESDDLFDFAAKRRIGDLGAAYREMYRDEILAVEVARQAEKDKPGGPKRMPKGAAKAPETLSVERMRQMSDAEWAAERAK